MTISISARITELQARLTDQLGEVVQRNGNILQVETSLMNVGKILNNVPHTAPESRTVVCMQFDADTQIISIHLEDQATK